MMGIYRHYECPACLTQFRFFHHPNASPPPEFCPLCAARDPEPVFVPSAPHVARTIGKSADQVYRQMETASAEHAEMVAELGGGEARDYAKVTDLADYLRPGDIAAKIPPNPVSTQMAVTGQGGFRPFAGITGAEFAANTREGAFPRRGEATRQNLVATHQGRVRTIENAGRLARTK